MTITIDLYSDIVCPWCIIGEHRLDKVLAERFPALRVEIQHHPVLLMPDCPPEGLQIAEMMKASHGVTDPAQAWARPQAEARASGLDLDLSRQPFAYPTIPAHTLIRLAASRGTQHALATAIISAYFQEGSNIGHADVLADIASNHGFERDEARRLAFDPMEQRRTRRDAAASRVAGVTSVPHLAFAKGLILTGCRSEDEIAEAIETTISRVGEHSHAN